MFESKKCITSSEQIMVASELRSAGYLQVTPKDIKKVENDYYEVFVVVLGDAMLVYTPAFVTPSNTGIKFIKF